jgi:hypothetical protein
MVTAMNAEQSRQFMMELFMQFKFIIGHVSDTRVK